MIRQFRLARPLAALAMLLAAGALGAAGTAVPTYALDAAKSTF